MTTATQHHTTSHSHFDLLRLVVDERIGKLENVVFKMYKVTAFEVLPEKAKEAIIYLNIVELEKKHKQVRNMYNLTREVLKVIVRKTHFIAMKTTSESDYLYTICRLYRSSCEQIEKSN